MPKAKPKVNNRKNQGGQYYYNPQPNSEDDSLDNVSVISNCSENKSVDDDDSEEFAQEQFEDKLVEILDGLTQKSVQGRTNCIQSLSKALIKKHIPNFIRDRHFTICDSIEKSLKKGASLEKSAAAELAALLCIQMGEEDTCEVIDKALRPILITIATDNSVAPSARAKCCWSLGVLGFVSEDELGNTLEMLRLFEGIFSGSYLKGDGSAPNVTPEVATLHAAALSAWTLLLTNMGPNVADLIETNTLPSLEQISELLESPHLEVRLTAGEALALIVEEGRQDNEDFAEDFVAEIAEVVKKLATDSHKYRAKKDRKQQRATFRDILQFLEDDLVPEVQVKFGGESVLLDTWARRKQYESLCNILGPGINAHLGENDLLRSIFNITAPPALRGELPPRTKALTERFRRRQANAAAFKARTITRGKNRDKRSDF